MTDTINSFEHKNLTVQNPAETKILEINQEYDGTSFISPLTREIKIYPNPNNGNFIIVTNGYFTEYNLYVYDYTGKIIFQAMNNTENKIDISIRNNPKGVYLIRLIDNNKQFISKIIYQ